MKRARAGSRASLMAIMAVQIEAIAEKVSGRLDNNITNGSNKRSNAKGHRPEKLEREGEKSWKLYTIGDNVEALHFNSIQFFLRRTT